MLFCQYGFSDNHLGSVLISCRKEPGEELLSMGHFDLCFLKVCADLNDLPHFEQLNGLSPVWVVSCFFKLPDVEHL